MNRSLYYIIPIVILLIGLIAWLFNCPWCILLPLLFSLGSAYFGWRMGLSDRDEKILKQEGDIANYKSQLQVAGQTPVSNNQDEVSEWRGKYAALNSERNKLNLEWEGKLSAMKTDYEKKIISLNLEKTNLLSQVGIATREVIKIAPVVKEAEVIKEIEVIKEVPVDVIKEVEVIKFADIDKKENKWRTKYKALKRSFDKDSANWELEKTDLLNQVSRASIKNIKIAKTATLLSTTGQDDLTKIEGIGNGVSKLLTSNGINSFKKLSQLNKSSILGILDKGGERFRLINPKTWSDQARLADKGDWKALKKLQDKV